MTRRRRRDPALQKIYDERTKRGVCRHCGGPVPCWSDFGDAEPGVGWRDLTDAEIARRGLKPRV